MATRKIIHIDMDAFYASIEQRDNPELRGKPLAVGYAGDRGVVAAASYEARRYGVRSAMASKTALRKCPHLIFVPGRFDAYRNVSRIIMDIFLDYTDLVEPLSLDEAYLDVTENHAGNPSATLIAKEIKQRILETTGLTASAGVSINKFLAKIASEYNKPDGLFVIEPADAEAFVEKLDVSLIHGVGKVTAEKMHRFGIRTGGDLKRFTLTQLTSMFGKAGVSYYNYARATDHREVNPHRERKSIGAENTFMTDYGSYEELDPILSETAEEVWKRLSRKEFYGRTVTVKAKYDDFTIVTRSRTLPGVIREYELFHDTAHSLLRQVDLSQKKVRLLGITMSNADDAPFAEAIQLRLNFSAAERNRER